MVKPFSRNAFKAHCFELQIWRLKTWPEFGFDSSNTVNIENCFLCESQDVIQLVTIGLLGGEEKSTFSDAISATVFVRMRPEIKYIDHLQNVCREFFSEGNPRVHLGEGGERQPDAVRSHRVEF